MGTVFISYKSEDRAMIAPLAQALERAGHEVWWDKKIAAGGTWRDTIAGALEAARVVVVAWSKRTEDSAAASWVLNEVDEAQRLGKPIIPVQLEACVIPLGYRHVQAANLTGWTGDPSHPEWQEVLAGVETALAGRRVGAASSSSGSSASRPASPARKGGLWVALGLMGLGLAITGGGFLAYNSYRNAQAAAVAEEFGAEEAVDGALVEAPPPDVPEPPEVAPPVATRPVAVMFGDEGAWFRRLQGDVWVETDYTATVRFQWVRMSGDAPMMELYDQSRDMWLLFDFDRNVIQLRIGDGPYADQWPIAEVETEPME